MFKTHTKNYQIITLDIYVDDQMVSSDDIEPKLNDADFCELTTIASRYIDFIKNRFPNKLLLLDDSSRLKR